MELEKFINLSFTERYEYTLNKIASSKKMWILRREDKKISVNVGVNNKLELLIWADKKHAEYNLVGTFKDNIPEQIDYNYFLENVLHKLEDNSIKILLSAMQQTRGKIITYKTFIDYIENYE